MLPAAPERREIIRAWHPVIRGSFNALADCKHLGLYACTCTDLDAEAETGSCERGRLGRSNSNTDTETTLIRKAQHVNERRVSCV